MRPSIAFKSSLLAGCLASGALLVLAASGCSEASDDGSTTGLGGALPTATSTGSNVTTGSTGQSAGGSGSTGDGTTASSSSGAGVSGVVINEMSGAGDDYIELYNAGTASADLSNLRIADQDTPGVPKLTSAVSLPKGTSLPPGAYLFILGGVDKPATGPATDCAPGPAPCFQAGYKLSNKDGDAVFLVDQSGAVLESESYPGNLDDGQTWSRLPNGTGSFAAGKSTPGAANQAP